MQLYRGVLVATFGRHRWRWVAVVAGSFAVGLGMARLARTVPLQQASFSPGVVWLGCAVGAQTIAAFALWGNLGRLLGGTRHRMEQLILSWPLGRWQCFVCLQLPVLALLGVTCLSILPPILVLAPKLGLAAGWALLGVVLGCASASGLVLSRGGSWLWTLLAPGVLFGEYRLMHVLYSQTATASDRTVAACSLVAVLAWSLCQIRNLAAQQRRRVLQARATRPPLPWPVAGWVGAKLVRTARLRLSFGCIALGSSGLAAGLHHWQLYNTTVLGFAAAVLAAAFAADLRSLARQHKPAEIAGLRGTFRYQRAVLLTSLLSVGVATAPLCGLAYTWGNNALAVVAAQLVCGTAVGLLAGTWLAPDGRDVSGQIGANLLCIGLIAGLQQLPTAATVLANHPVSSWLAAALFGLLAAEGIEYKRNTFDWSTLWKKLPNHSSMAV